ncbi:MAG: hypothetical protein IT221_00805 [Fluviicola sp.]|nr:hypothetical protein [Fluviicola sp.]
MTQFKRVKLLVFPVFLLISSISFSQGKLSSQQLNESWQLLDESNGVKVFAQKQKCALSAPQMPLEFVFIRVENTTTSSVNVSYQLASIYSEGCVGCDANPETAISINVPAGASVTSTCEENKPGLQVLINNPNLKKGWSFQAIQLNGFKVITK